MAERTSSNPLGIDYFNLDAAVADPSRIRHQHNVTARAEHAVRFDADHIVVKWQGAGIGVYGPRGNDTTSDLRLTPKTKTVKVQLYYFKSNPDKVHAVTSDGDYWRMTRSTVQLIGDEFERTVEVDHD